MVKRDIGLDYLRILACLMVVCIHVSAESRLLVSCENFNWSILTFFLAVCRACVPIFFMVSGYLFLSKSKEKVVFSHILLRYVSRIIIIYVVWGLFYSALVNMGYFHHVAFIDYIKIIIYSFIKEPMYHLWYLVALVIIYMFIPILYRLVHDILNHYDYKCICICLVLSIIFLGIVSKDNHNLSVNSLISYVLYFLLGYYLYMLNTKKGRVWLLICIFIVSVGIVSYVNIDSAFQSMNNNTSLLFSYNSLFTCLEAICLFKLFIHRKIINMNKLRFIEISKNTLFVYIFHIFMIMFLNTQFNLLYRVSCHPVVGVIVSVSVIFMICEIISYILRKLDFIKKWLL